MWQSGTVGEYKYSVLGHILVVLMLIIASLCDHEFFLGRTYLGRWESRHSEYARTKGSQRRGRQVFELLAGWTR
jgi:hypothetical protein